MGELRPLVHLPLNIFNLLVIVCAYSAALPPNIWAPRMVCARTVRIFRLPEYLVLISPKDPTSAFAPNLVVLFKPSRADDAVHIQCPLGPPRSRCRRCT